METPKEFIEQYMRTSFTEDDLHMDCDMTWDTVFSMMGLYGEHCSHPTKPNPPKPSTEEKPDLDIEITRLRSKIISLEKELEVANLKLDEQWISVLELMPEESSEVDVFDVNGEIYTVTYFETDGDFNKAVLFWRKRPEPPSPRKIAQLKS